MVLKILVLIYRFLLYHTLVVFGSELWNLTPSDIEKLKRCQRWFVRKVFCLPIHSDVFSLHIFRGLTSVELQIDVRKCLFFARTVSSDVKSPVVRDILRFRAIINKTERSYSQLDLRKQAIAF